jgi:hypothetical protein
VKIASIYRFEYRKTSRQTSLVNLLSSEVLAAYVAWLRQPLAGPIGTK